jgi:hypothetical protein
MCTSFQPGGFSEYNGRERVKNTPPLSQEVFGEREIGNFGRFETGISPLG